MELDTIESKLEVARQKKATADAAFKAGDLTNALRAYYEVLLYAEGLEKSGSGLSSILGAEPVDNAPKERTEADELIEKAYANMSACHIKRENWKRAQETAEKALAKKPEELQGHVPPRQGARRAGVL